MEKQERKSRLVLFIAFLITLTSIALLAGALGSDDWVNSNLIPDTVDSSLPPVRTDDGYAKHGLFKGKGTTSNPISSNTYNIRVNCSFAARVCHYEAVSIQDGSTLSASNIYEESMSITDKCRQTSGDKGTLYRPGEINFWIWLATLVFVCLAILCGLIAAIFTMVNVIYVPISDIAGVRGIYVWNAVACLFTLIALCVWAGLHYSHLRYNMLPTFFFAQKNTNCGLAEHGAAVWLCLAALILFFCNIVLVRFRRGHLPSRKSRMRAHSKGEELTLY